MTEAVIITTLPTGPDAPIVAAVVDPKAPVVPAGLPSDIPAEETPVVPAVVADPAEFVMPEKFKGKSAEEIAKSYTELEKAKGVTPTPAVPPVNTDTAKIEATAEVQAATDVVAKAGLNFTTLNDTYAKDGKLAAADYTALEKQGIPKAMVNSFIAGQIAIGKAAGVANAQVAHEAAGSPEKYAEAVQWAAKGGLDKASIVAFNKAIDSNDASVIKLNVTGLMASFSKAIPNEPNNVASSGKGTGASTYKSNQEVMKDMGDPRYQKDPAFRKLVEAKVARSNNVL